MIRAVTTHEEGFRHLVAVDGHEIVVDEPVGSGGGDAGPSPTRLLAAALASCTAITVRMYANRKGWDLGESRVAVDFPGPPRAGEEASFKVELTLPGDLDEDQRSRIETIAKKCPVHRTLAATVKIQTRAILATS